MQKSIKILSYNTHISTFYYKNYGQVDFIPEI
jgi:hypothetical protein